MRADFYLIQKPRFREEPLLLVCELARKAQQAGQACIVLARDAAQAEKLDDLLWSFDPDAFIPHQIVDPGMEEGDDEEIEVLIAAPEHDVALAVTSEQENMQATLDLVWRHLVPAVDRAGSPAADAELADLLASRRIEPLTGDPAEGDDVTLARAPDSDLSRRYSGATIRRDGSGAVVDLRRDEQVLTVHVGAGEWAASTLTSGGYDLPVVASGGWRDGDTFVADVVVIETPV